MIQDLTIENLLNSGLNIKDATELFNIENTYNLQCNSGHFYVSKHDDKFYTGTDYFRITHLQKGNLQFPYNCPDLSIEYFDLALTEFIQKQKEKLGLLYDVKHETNKFIANEIERTNLTLTGRKEFLEKSKHLTFSHKHTKTTIDVCESYIHFLNDKAIAPQQLETTNKNVSNLIQGTNQNATNLFFYLIENYRPNEKKTVVYCNVWHYLKNDSDKNHFTFKIKQDNYKEFILNKFNHPITKFAKNDLYLEDEKPILHSLENAFLKTLTP